MTSSEKIKQIRLQKGLTQKELSKKCFIDDANLRKYESGRQKPKLETIKKIADALEVPVWQLVDDDDMTQYTHEAHQLVTDFGTILGSLVTPRLNNITSEEERERYRKSWEAGLEKSLKEVESLRSTLTEKELCELDGETASTLTKALNKKGREKVIHYLMDIVRIPEYRE